MSARTDGPGVPLDGKAISASNRSGSNTRIAERPMITKGRAEIVVEARAGWLLQPPLARLRRRILTYYPGPPPRRLRFDGRRPNLAQAIFGMRFCVEVR